MADLLYGLQGVAADSGEDVIIEDEEAAQLPGSMPEMDVGSLPTPEDLLKMLDGMTGLSDEDKETLKADLLKSVENGNQYGPPPPEPFTSQALILFALLAVIALIFAFFGYKLYKSLVERERKREEKRKLKQLKKKK